MCYFTVIFYLSRICNLIILSHSRVDLTAYIFNIPFTPSNSQSLSPLYFLRLYFLYFSRRFFGGWKLCYYEGPWNTCYHVCTHTFPSFLNDLAAEASRLVLVLSERRLGQSHPVKLQSGPGGAFFNFSIFSVIEQRIFPLFHICNYWNFGYYGYVVWLTISYLKIAS